MGTLQTLLALVVLIYILCVVVQFMQEGVKALLNTKGETMRKVIQNFMGDKLLQPDQVKAALTSRGLDGLAALEHLNKEDFRKLIDIIPFTQDQLQALSEAKVTVDQFKDHAEAAYDAAMAKFRRLYAAKNRQWVIAVSFAVVLALNANLVRIYEELAADQVMSQAITGTASKLEKTSNQQGNAGVQPLSSAEDFVKVYNDNRQAIEGNLREYPILVRWNKWRKDYQGNGTGGALYTFLGLPVMALLLSLGAPFWNDVLKGVTGINNVLNTGGKKQS
jgi:hypothetical protein